MSGRSGRPARLAVLSLGSNLGDRLGHLQAGLDGLAAANGIALAAVSRVYETEPVGVSGQPPYLNAVAVVSTRLDPSALVAAAQAVEAAEGRVRGERWAARTLDVDVVDLAGVTSTSPDAVLPHPRASSRAFVLRPWLDVDPDAELPGHGRVDRLLSGLGSAAGAEVRARPDLVLMLPPVPEEAAR